MSEHLHEFSLVLMCRVLEVAGAGFYPELEKSKPPQQQDAGITAEDAAVERCFDRAAPDLPSRDGFIDAI